MMIIKCYIESERDFDEKTISFSTAEAAVLI